MCQGGGNNHPPPCATSAQCIKATEVAYYGNLAGASKKTITLWRGREHSEYFI